MSIRFTCECRRVFVVSDGHAGKAFRCPSCDARLMVPAHVSTRRARRQEALAQDAETAGGVPGALARYLAWPAFAGGGFVLAYVGSQRGHNMELVVIGIFSAMLVLLTIFESVLPFRRRWHWRDGQVPHNLAHTAVSTFLALYFSAVLVVVLLWPLGKNVRAAMDVSVWPQQWPVWTQVILMVGLWDFVAYWTHRWSHEWGWLWRVHALHHSPPVLHAINAGRVHVLDTLKTELVALPLLVLAGAPLNVLVWYLAFFRIIGVLSHCNVDMRLGPLSYVFNTPEVHRWHHSAVLEEEHTNYGQNFMIWDQLFGTYRNPPGAAPAVLGSAAPIPEGFFGQVVSPILWERRDEAANWANAEG